jgi:hypothetical protein
MAANDDDVSGQTEPTVRSWKTKFILFLLLLVFMLVAALLTNAFNKAPDYDEAVYLSQVTRGAPQVEFTGPRSRGITFLVAPLTVVGAPLWAVRLWLAFLTTVGLALAYRTWSRTVDFPVALAASAFGGSWLAIFYALQIYPNMPSAVVALAAAGTFASWYMRRRTLKLVALAALLALHGLIRPVDATAMVLALALSTLLLKTGRRTVLVVLVVGLLLAWVPWVAEAYGRCGGPVARLHASSANVGGGLRFNVPKFVAMADGPLIWPEHPVHIAWEALVWIGSALLLLVAGIARGVRRGNGKPVMIAGISAVALAAPYLFLEGGDGSIAPRFLLPAFACASIPIAAGVALLWGSRIARAVLLIMAGALVVWHLGVLSHINRGDQERRADAVAIGHTLRVMSGGRPCVFGSLYGFPTISLTSGCEGFRFRPPRAAVQPVALILGGGPPDPCSGLHISGDPLMWLRTRALGGKEQVFVVLYGASALESEGYPEIRQTLPSGKSIAIIQLSTMDRPARSRDREASLDRPLRTPEPT